MGNNTFSIIFVFLIAFILSFYFSQVIEDTLENSEDFVFKDLLQFLIPGPEDNVLELVQFLLYWAAPILGMKDLGSFDGGK